MFVAQCARTDLALLAQLCRRVDLGCCLVVVECPGARLGICGRSIGGQNSWNFGAGGEPGEPPTDLLRRRAVSDVPVPGKGKSNSGGEVADRKRCAWFRHVVMRTIGREPYLLNDLTNKGFGPLGNE